MQSLPTLLFRSASLFVLGAMTFLLFAGCRPSAPSIETEGSLRVLVSVEPVADLIRQLAGDDFEVVVLVPSGQEPETFTLTPAHMTAISGCSAFFPVGFPMETPLLPRLKSAVPQLQVVDLQQFADGEDLGSHHEGEGVDPHLWMSPAVMKRALPAVAQALIVMKPDSEERVHSRLEELIANLTNLEEEISAQTASLPERVLYVFHPAYGYFCRQFNLVQEAMERDGHSPSPKEMADWIRRLQVRKIQLIVAQPEFSQAQMISVSEQSGVPVEVHSPLESDYYANLRHLVQLFIQSQPKEE